MAFAAKDQAQSLFKRGTEETTTTRRKSERDAENNTPPDEDVPKSKKVRTPRVIGDPRRPRVIFDPRRPRVIGDPRIPINRERRAGNELIRRNIKDTVALRARQLKDTAKLRKRREQSKNRAFKKSGAEIIRQKNIEEIRAKNVLRQKGATFGGRGKFGREKLFGNSNFDLGLPSSATQADRDRVIARKARIDAARARRKARRNNVDIGAKRFQGKTEAELKAIALERGLKITGSVDARTLTNILLRTGGL